jgi:hypothetical protein
VQSNISQKPGLFLFSLTEKPGLFLFFITEKTHLHVLKEEAVTQETAAILFGFF